jgi:hypothetical protein
MTAKGGLSPKMGGFIQPVPMHWAEAELLRQAARELEAASELDRRHRDLAELLNYRDWLIVCAAASGAEEAEIARAAGITCGSVRKVIEQSQTREGRDENAVRRSA